MSSRPRRSCTQTQPTPILKEVVDQAVDCTEEEVRALFEKVKSYFKGDTDRLAALWLSDTGLFRLRVPQHNQLMALVLENISLRDEAALTYLNTLTSDQIQELGLVRVRRADKFYYRIQVGEKTSW